jgi:hypothetical protein
VGKVGKIVQYTPKGTFVRDNNDTYYILPISIKILYLQQSNVANTRMLQSIEAGMENVDHHAKRK